MAVSMVAYKCSYQSLEKAINSSRDINQSAERIIRKSANQTELNYKYKVLALQGKGVQKKDTKVIKR